MKKNNPNYGQELKPLLWILTTITVVLVSGIIYFILHDPSQSSAMIVMGSFALFFGVIIGTVIWSSKTGKLIMRDKIIEELHLKGSENVLDVGCGKGLLTVGIAKKIQSGKVVGLDHWQGTFEYNYTREMAEKNIAIERVGDKVELVPGDAKKLPFTDGKFDIISSSLTMHHVGDGNQAFKEMLRVLKPCGFIAIADMPSPKIKNQMLEEGFEIVMEKPLVRLFFIKVRLIIAKKK